MNKFTNVSVIVPAYNSAHFLGKCLEGLLAQKLCPGFTLEIIVVDDGSTDGTAALVREYPRVKLIQIPHRGAAAARNAGVRAASCQSELILFTDADCVPSPEWAVRLSLALLNAHPGVVGIKGAYCTQQPSLIAQFAQAEYEERYTRFSTGQARPGFADTYSAAYRRKILLDFPFDESLPGAIVEDAELGWRLKQAGYQFEFQPGALVYHQHPARLVSYFRRKFRIGRWRLILYRRYPGQLSQDGHTSKLAKLQMLLLLLALAEAGLLMLARFVARQRIGKAKNYSRQVDINKINLTGLIFALGLLQLSFWPTLQKLGRKKFSLMLTGWLMLNVRTLAFTSGALVGVAQILLEKLGLGNVRQIPD